MDRPSFLWEKGPLHMNHLINCDTHICGLVFVYLWICVLLYHIRGVGQFDCLYLGSQTNIKGMTERLATDLPYLIFVTGGTREETSVMWRNSTWAIVMWTTSPNLLQSSHFCREQTNEVCYLLHLWHLVSSFCICFVYLLCLFCICVLFGLCF